MNVINGLVYGNVVLRLREKEDYIMGLEIVLKYNLMYILMFEDDVLLFNNLFNNLCFVLNYWMFGRFLKSCCDWVFLKFYYFEKW